MAKLRSTKRQEEAVASEASRVKAQGARGKALADRNKARSERAEERKALLHSTEASVVELAVPVLEHGTALISRLDFRITPRQSKALRLLFDGLVAEGETIELGGMFPVSSQADGLRWVLDQVAEAAST